MKRPIEYVEKLPDDAKLVEGTDCYYVDTHGNVYSTRGRIKKLRLKKQIDGYLQVIIYYPQPNGKKSPKDKFVHTLVCEAFFGKREGREVNHKNGNKADNSVSNLEWCTHKENIQHAWRTGLADSKHIKGKPKSDETKRKIGEANKGSNNTRSKKVAMYEYPTDRLIKVFNGRNEATRELGKGITVYETKPKSNRTGYYFLYV